MIYFCDKKRHLVCYPYSKKNLHVMADALDIAKCWYHAGKFAHYDIPKKRYDEIRDKCLEVRPRFILDIVKGKI